MMKNTRFFCLLKSAIRNSQCAILITAMLFALSFVSAVLLAFFPAEAQQPKKVYRIRYISGTDAATDSPRAKGIRLALRELGYIEGDNIVIEYRHAEGRGRQPELAAELVGSKVDVILVAGGDNVIWEQ
jgi:hypothetical protein